MSVAYDPPPRRLLVDPPKHVAATHRSWLFYGVSAVSLAPGMMAAELAERKQRIADWIAVHPEQARQLSKQVERGQFGDVRAP